MERKKYFLFFLAIFFFFSHAQLLYAATAAAPTTPVKITTAYSGVEGTIKQYLCTPTDASTGNSSANNKAGNDLYLCVNKLYRFALVIASVVAVFFIVIAGYVYMSAEGNSESVDKAKSILTSSIASLIILFAGYILLRFLNPDLILFHPIQPVSVIGGPKVSGGTGCTGCVDISTLGVSTGGRGSIMVASALANKIKTIGTVPGANWYVTASYDPDPNHHISNCHTNDGTCADLGITDKGNANAWLSLCAAIKKAGLNIVANEASKDAASGCGTYKTYSTTTGPNLHIE